MKCPYCHSTTDETYFVINEIEEVVKRHSLGKDYDLPPRVIAELMVGYFENYCKEIEGIKKAIEQDVRREVSRY